MRAPVQGDAVAHLPDDHPAAVAFQEREGRSPRPPGTIEWREHAEAWDGYAARFGAGQSAERLAERGGFSFGELLMFLEREPSTWTAT